MIPISIDGGSDGECWGEWVCGFYLSTAAWCDEQMAAAAQAVDQNDIAMAQAYVRIWTNANCGQVDRDIREHCEEGSGVTSFFPTYCWE